MGFNDEPFDISLVTHALTTRQRQRVIEADTPRQWNLMWPAAGIPDGSFYFTNEPNQLDQFLINATMAGRDQPTASSTRIRANPPVHRNR